MVWLFNIDLVPLVPTFHSKQEYIKYESTTMSDHLKIMKQAPGTPKIKKCIQPERCHFENNSVRWRNEVRSHSWRQQHALRISLKLGGLGREIARAAARPSRPSPHWPAKPSQLEKYSKKYKIVIVLIRNNFFEIDLKWPS